MTSAASMDRRFRLKAACNLRIRSVRAAANHVYTPIASPSGDSAVRRIAFYRIVTTAAIVDREQTWTEGEVVDSSLLTTLPAVSVAACRLHNMMRVPARNALRVRGGTNLPVRTCLRCMAHCAGGAVRRQQQRGHAALLGSCSAAVFAVDCPCCERCQSPGQHVALRHAQLTACVVSSRVAIQGAIMKTPRQDPPRICRAEIRAALQHVSMQIPPS